MPCDFVINVEQRLVRTTLRGAVTGDELRELRDRIAADPAFTPDLSVLIDLRDATSEALTTADIRGLAQTSKFGRGARRAFVSPEPATFGLARMFEIYREIGEGQEQTATFRNIADAEAWLAMGE